MKVPFFGSNILQNLPTSVMRSKPGQIFSENHDIPCNLLALLYISNCRHKARKMTIPTLSKKEMEICRLLVASAGDQLHGLEMVNRSDGALKSGTVYMTLFRMEDKGYVESVTVATPPGEKGPPRRKYKLTRFGREIYAAWMVMADTVQALVADASADTGNKEEA